jgi:RecQ family ATP-dependent DNA helicase
MTGTPPATPPDPPVPAPARRAHALLRDHARAAGSATGSLADACTVLAAARLPSAPAAVRAMLSQAGRGGLLSFDGDRYVLTDADLGPAAAAAPADSPDATAAGDGPDADAPAEVRVVALDLEAAVRTSIDSGGAFTRAIWQIGAVRFGPDTTWVDAAPRFSAHVAVPEGFEIPPHAAADHATYNRPAADVLPELVDWLTGADLLVAYNGTGLDFPVLADALGATGLQLPDLQLVDGLYLAHCLWPAQPTHRLTDLMRDLGVPPVGHVHDALDDAANLATLMQAGADDFAAMEPVQQEVITALTDDSAAWRLIRGLTGATATVPARSAADIAGWLHTHLAVQRPRRGGTPGPLTIPSDFADADGHIDPVLLAARLHPGTTEPRPGQQAVAAAIRTAAATATPVLGEAPTGTGKSLAAFAGALEWLHADSRHTAIISTHSKGLQTQLASEIERLSGQLPGLLDTTDVVKGASNRLSLRGLVVTLAEANGADVGPAGSLVRYTDDPGFRELLVFVTLRLVHPSTTATYRWNAHSVDTADLPAFFRDYLGGRLPRWAASLSQSAHGEYDDPTRVPLAAFTDTVGEAIDAHRLIIANHALLLAHWPELAPYADQALLIVDEAHALEGAATDALSPELSTADIDDALGSVASLVVDLQGATGQPTVAAHLRDMRDWWSDAALRRRVSSVLDKNIGDVAVGSRTLTLASPYLTEHAARDARPLVRLLAQLHGLAGRLSGGLGRLLAANAGTLDPFDEQRIFAATFRLGALADVADRLGSTIDALLAPPAAASPGAAVAPPSGSAPAGGADPGQPPADGDNQDEDRDDDAAAADLDVESADPDDEADATTLESAVPDTDDQAGGEDHDNPTGAAPTGPAAAPAAPPPGRVVYVREDGDVAAGLPGYRVTLVSSPILLSDDADWSAFTRTFRRLALLSATLRVTTPGKDPWAFIRARLGLADAATVVVDGPFDYHAQARLVALADFPSWAEQPKQAMRTVAHQLTGWAGAMSRRARPDGGPWMHGAMVLTTSRAAAGGIADELAHRLSAGGPSIPVHNQVIYGTRRAADDFRGPDDEQGGFLIGTRGLWTGVDISEPDRMNLVWINKLPFPVFTDPVIAARREQVRRTAEADGADDPDLVASSEYYLPLAALDLRQAVGRLIRNRGSRGVVVISDRKLAGDLPLRRLYRQVFLGSLDPGLHVPDPNDPTDTTGGNIVPMTDAWRTIWHYLGGCRLLSDDQVDSLTRPDALERHTVLPATLEIRKLAMSDAEVATHRAAGSLVAEVERRATRVAELLTGAAVTLRDEQRQAIAAAAADTDVLALLPTGFGKSFCFQLPALVLPGVTVVISPLIALMHDQALSLNHTIGGAVRALVSSLPESSSRAGRTQVIEQMTDPTCSHGIRIVYVSPERLTQARFRDALTRGVEQGIVRRVAIDEAHTYVQWGDDFRPSFRRAGALLRQLRATHPDKLTLMTLTATATRSVEQALREEVLGGLVDGSGTSTPRPLRVVRVNPLRPELTLARRRVATRSTVGMTALAEQVLDAATAHGHTIVYCLTVRQVDQLYAHLRDYTAGRPLVLRKFHGRLSELEKAAVSGEFNEAPTRGGEGYAPMVVVATSAFGLGVSRSDIRTVCCVSPPTDLAALYQQLGRGGRDMAGRPLADVDTATYALTLATDKTLDTAQWLASQDLPPALLTEFGTRVLTEAATGSLDLASTRDALLSAHVAAGTLSLADSRDPRLREAWKVGLTRAVAALADLEVITDFGDVPARIAVTGGTRPAVDPLSRAVLEAVLDLPLRGGEPSRSSAALPDLLRHLTGDPRCRAAGLDHRTTLSDLWLLLCDLHDDAILDVSQRPNTHMLIGLTANGTTTLPAQYVQRITGKFARAAGEAAALRAFFAVGAECLNARLARYFSVPTPASCCSTDQVKCSVCAVQPGGPGLDRDGVVGALLYGRLRPAATDPAVRAGRIDAAVLRMLRQHFNGATAVQIRLVLRGEHRQWIPTQGRYRRLPTRLTDNSQFGQLPTLTQTELADSLSRLAARQQLRLEDVYYWRTAANAAVGPRRGRAPTGTPAGGGGQQP